MLNNIDFNLLLLNPVEYDKFIILNEIREIKKK